jgi:uncharacterized delta-60 repeat protein
MAARKPEVELLERRDLLQAGSLDSVFGMNGLATTGLTFSAYNTLLDNYLASSTYTSVDKLAVTAKISYGSTVAIQSNGDIVVAGVSSGATSAFSTARFLPNGNLDTSFGKGGIVTTHFGAASTDQATSVAIQPNGDIVVAGDTNVDGFNDFGVVRYLSDGTFDPSFNGGAPVVIDFYNPYTPTKRVSSFVSAVAIEPNGEQDAGRIVVAGTSTFPDAGSPTGVEDFFTLSRLNSDGTEDNDFHANGKLIFDFSFQWGGGQFGFADGINAMAIQPDGNIVVAGYTGLNASTHNSFDPFLNIAVTRILGQDGLLDAKFGSSGVIDTDYYLSLGGNTDALTDLGTSVTIMSNKDVAVAGMTQIGDAFTGQGGGNNFALAVYTGAGGLDLGYTPGGLVANNFDTAFSGGSLGNPGENSLATSVVQQPDGKLELGGFTDRDFSHNTFALERLNTDGTLDQTFGLHGQSVTEFNVGTSNDAIANLVLETNGDALATGTTNPGTGAVFGMAQYISFDNGTLPGLLQFSTPTYSVNENGGFLTVTVLRSGGSDGEVNVNYTTTDGTAKHDVNYTTTTGTLNFAQGVTTQSFTVPIRDDDVFTPSNYTFTITLSSPTSGSAITDPSLAVVTIVDTDQPISFTSATYSVNENAGSALVTVTRPTGTGSVSVDYATSDGTARGISDYTPESGTLVFTAGVTSMSFEIPITDVHINDPVGRTFNINLSNPVNGGAVGTPGQAVVTINENDVLQTLQFSSSTYSVSESGGNAVLTINRGNGSTGSVSVNFATSDGSGHALTNYSPAFGTVTFPVGVTSLNILVPITDIHAADATGTTFSVTLSNPSAGALIGSPGVAQVTIKDDDQVIALSASSYGVGEGAQTFLVMVTRTGSLAGTQSVNYATSDGTAKSGSGYTPSSGTLTFAPGVSSLTIPIPIIDLHVTGGSTTFFDITLSNPTTGAALGTPSVAVISINANDQPLQFGQAGYTVLENAGSLTVVVNRANGNGSTAIDFATSDGSAKAGVNYTATSGTLTFAPGAATASFTIPILDDGVFHSPNDTFNITLSSPQSGGALGAIGTAVVTILETDKAPAAPPTNALFVSALYVQLLGRQADAGGAAYWTGLLNNGVPRSQVAADILNSAEYRVDVIDKLYMQYLGRQADPAGMGAFLAQSEAGVTDEQIAVELINSPEFFQRAGGTNTGFLSALYSDALNRPIDPSGLSNWGQLLTLGLPRVNVATDIVTSAEYYAGVVRYDYQTYLGRPADSVGLNGFVAQLQSGASRALQPIFVGTGPVTAQGTTDETVLAIILGSQEFYNLV